MLMSFDIELSLKWFHFCCGEIAQWMTMFYLGDVKFRAEVTVHEVSTSRF